MQCNTLPVCPQQQQQANDGSSCCATARLDEPRLASAGPIQSANFSSTAFGFDFMTSALLTWTASFLSMGLVYETFLCTILLKI